MSGVVNLYEPRTKGYYIYKDKQRYEKWLGARIWPCKKKISACFYSADDAKRWIDTMASCPDHPTECCK
jgi:hypothetical protein